MPDFCVQVSGDIKEYLYEYQHCPEPPPHTQRVIFLTPGSLIITMLNSLLNDFQVHVIYSFFVVEEITRLRK